MAGFLEVESTKPSTLYRIEYHRADWAKPGPKVKLLGTRTATETFLRKLLAGSSELSGLDYLRVFSAPVIWSALTFDDEIVDGAREIGVSLTWKTVFAQLDPMPAGTIVPIDTYPAAIRKQLIDEQWVERRGRAWVRTDDRSF